MRTRTERICGACHLADAIEALIPVGLHWSTGTVLYRHGDCVGRLALQVAADGGLVVAV